MLARRKCLILTLFILSCSLVAKSAEDVTVTDIKQTTSGSENEPPKGLEDMILSKTPKVKQNKINNFTQEVYFPYQSSISPRLGVGSDSKRFKNNEYYYLFGLLYQLANDQGLHWEAGADVLNDGTGVLSMGLKNRMSRTEALRPFYKVAGAIHVDPSEQLTTFLRNENFQIRPSAGFEYFLEHPSSIRLEVESWISNKSLGFHLCMGYSYAW